MQLTCPACTARYVVNPASLGENGRKVKCAKCGNLWFVAPPPPPEPESLSPEPVVDMVDSGISADELAHNFASELAAQMTGLNKETGNVNIQLPAERKAKRRRLSLPSMPRWALPVGVAGLVIIILSGLLGFALSKRAYYQEKHTIRQALTQLEFSNVVAETRKEGEATLLTIRGTLTNKGTMATALPKIKAAIKDEKDTIVQSWEFDIVATAPEPPPAPVATPKHQPDAHGGGDADAHHTAPAAENEQTDKPIGEKLAAGAAINFSTSQPNISTAGGTVSLSVEWPE